MSSKAEELWSCSLGREVLRDTVAARDCRGQGGGVGRALATGTGDPREQGLLRVRVEAGHQQPGWSPVLGGNLWKLEGEEVDGHFQEG